MIFLKFERGEKAMALLMFVFSVLLVSQKKKKKKECELCLCGALLHKQLLHRLPELQCFSPALWCCASAFGVLGVMLFLCIY